ncbi:hypothetical protein [Variovorax boronicumulans]|uniref:hypothetical protein n=1 Tax=Variovorax boronicumulans TaxID=436515 RepID=UPI0012FDBA38|nr:hypothetical protein [Variovorax boronicumulans]
MAFYDKNPAKSFRNVSPAAVNKINYIAGSFQRIGCDIEIVSPTWRVKPGDSGNSEELGGLFPVRFAPELKYSGIFRGVLNVLFVNFWLFFFICFKFRRREKVLVYHSLAIIPAIFFARLVKSINVVLQVEELYTSVGNWHSVLKKLEAAYVATVGCSYLLSTEMLENVIPEHKFRAFVYGAYFFGKKQPDKSRGGRNRIKLLYAGIIDEDKKGAFNAVRAAAYLDGAYELHIVGFGDVERLLLEIEKCKSKSECKISYDGYMSGSEFDEYCSDFDIGLSTQSSTGEYVSSSFPSKVLTYLLFGMRVVSPQLECLTRSAVGHLVNYYDADDPLKIAEAIVSVNFEDGFSCLDELEALDAEFRDKLKILFC